MPYPAVVKNPTRVDNWPSWLTPPPEFPAVLELMVTKEDWKLGRVGNPVECPVARALARRFDGAKTTVGVGRASVFPKNCAMPEVTYRLPGNLRWRVSAFDMRFHFFGWRRRWAGTYSLERVSYW